ncbi:MAG: biotin/lipoyl-containing protein [Thermodesulfobacteriota bacterium]
MQNEIDYDSVLSQYRQDPFAYEDIHTRHTGQVRFHVRDGAKVEGASGEFRHIKGTLLCELTRERNKKPIHSVTKGEVSFLRSELEGKFVEAGEKIMTIRHPLKKKEIIEQILRKVLKPFKAPEKAKYYFAMDIQNRIDKFGQRSVKVKSGDEIFTMSLMKRDTPVYYEGEAGIIHSVYFSPGQSVEQGEPLMGICPPEILPLVEKIITRVKAEWE